MSRGDLRGTLTASVNSVTNPTVASGSVVVSVGDLVFGTMAQQTNLTAGGTVTDNLGNTYSYVNAGTDAGTIAIRSFYARVTNAGTLTTVNVPATASTNDASVVVDVIEGPFLTSPLDANPANASDATTPFTCPATGTLAQANEVVMAAIALAATQTVAATSPSSLTGTVSRANASCGQSRRVVSATTTVTPEFTGTSATAAQVTASFKLDMTQALTPSLFTDGDTFHQPTVTPGAVGLTASLFTDGDTFHQPTVLSTYPLTADLFSDGDTFHTPTVDQEASDQDLTPSLYVDADSFHQPTVSPGAVDLTVSLFSDGDTFPSATVVSIYPLDVSLFVDGDTFMSATVTPGAINLDSGLFSDGDTFPSATVTAVFNLTASLFSDDDTFFSPTVQSTYGLTSALFTDGDTFPSAVVGASNDLTPTVFVDGDTFPSATVTPGATDLSPSLYSDGDTFFSFSVSGEGELVAGLFVDGDTFPSPIVSSTTALDASLFVDGDVFPSATVESTYELIVSLHQSTNLFHSAIVSFGTSDQEIFASLFINLNTFFRPTIEGGVQRVAPRTDFVLAQDRLNEIDEQSRTNVLRNIDRTRRL